MDPGKAGLCPSSERAAVRDGEETGAEKCLLSSPFEFMNLWKKTQKKFLRILGCSLSLRALAFHRVGQSFKKGVASKQVRAALSCRDRGGRVGEAARLAVQTAQDRQPHGDASRALASASRAFVLFCPRHSAGAGALTPHSPPSRAARAWGHRAPPRTVFAATSRIGMGVRAAAAGVCEPRAAASSCSRPDRQATGCVSGLGTASPPAVFSFADITDY